LPATTHEVLPAALVGTSLTGWVYFRREIDDGVRYFLSPTGETWIAQTKSGNVLQFGDAIDHWGSDGREFVDAETAQQLVVGASTYRWNLIRETDPSGNTVYYVWADQKTALGTRGPGINNIQYLTDIYDTDSGAPSAPAHQFAHHVHLEWELRPPNAARVNPSPIWRAVPALRLTGVDVTSATFMATKRQLVRRYHLSYQMNFWNTLDELVAISLEGVCMNGTTLVPTPENSSGLLPTTNCPLLGGTNPPFVRYDYWPSAPLSGPGALSVNQSFSVNVAYASGDAPFGNGCGPWSPSPACGGFAMVDVNGDGIADYVNGALNENGQKNCYGDPDCSPGTVCTEPCDSFTGHCTCESPGTPKVAFPDTNVYVDFGPPPSAFAGVKETAFDIYAPVARPSATIAQLGPGFKGLAYGDWLSKGVLSWLWFSAPAGSKTDPGKYEIYTPYASLGSPAPLNYEGSGPLTSFSVTPDWQSGRALDLDGDGLPDQALVPYLPPGSLTTIPYSYLTTRDRTGAVRPFARRFGGGSYQMEDPSSYPNYLARAFADVDGDGLPDIVIVYSDPISPPAGIKLQVLTNRGDGSFGPSFDLAVGGDYTLTGAAAPAGPSRIAVGDLNGDGMADYAFVSPNGLQACIRTMNSGPTDFTCYSLTPSELRWADQAGAFFGETDVTIADIDGSGVQQILVWAANQKQVRTFTAVSVAANTRISPGGRAGLLQQVTSYTGAQKTLIYSNWDSLLAKAPSPAALGTVPVPLWVVTDTLTSNGASGAVAFGRSSFYSYQTPVYDPRDREFVGFQSVTETDPAEAGAPNRVRTTRFATGHLEAVQCATGSVDYSCNRLFRGLPILTEESDSVDNTRTRTLWTQYTARQLLPGLDGRTVWFEAPLQTNDYLWDPLTQSTATSALSFLSLTLLPSTVATEGPPPPLLYPPTLSSVELPTSATLTTEVFDYDTFGNLVSRVESGPGGAPVGEVRTWNPPATYPAGWTFRISDLQYGYVCGSPLLFCPQTRAIHYEHDALGRAFSASSILTGSRPLTGPDNSPASFAAGQPSSASVEGSKVYSRASVQYDVYGNPLIIAGPGNHCSGFTYDTLFHQLPVQVSTYLDGCGSPSPYVSSRTFDRGFENITQETSPAGPSAAVQRYTLTKYDSFGRPIEVDQPSADVPGTTDMAPEIKIQYNDLGPVRSVLYDTVDGPENAPAYVDHYDFIDGLGDNVASLDRFGSPLTIQYAVSGMHTRFANGLIRTEAKPYVFTGGASGFAAQLQLPSGQMSVIPLTRSFTYDGLGRTLTATDYANNVTTTTYRLGLPDVAVQVRTLDPEQQAGRLHAGSFTENLVDYLGRVTRLTTHLNVGPKGIPSDTTVTSNYLATGELFLLTERNETHSMQYDSLGRMVFNVEPNSSVVAAPGGGTGLQAWTYAYNDAGEIVGASDARGCGEVVYRDALGRVIAEDYSPCDPKQPAYTPPSLVNSLGSLAGDGTEAYYVYDPFGQLHAVSDRAQASIFNYDGRGRIASVRRQIARPDAPSALVERYAPHFFQATVSAYTAGNRAATVTTGAEASELTSGAGDSQVSATYSADGTLSSVTSSYGNLLAAQSVDALGSVRSQQFGDAASTMATMGYDAKQQLFAYDVTRATRGPWSGYTRGATSPNDPQQATEPTLQSSLSVLGIGYDRVGDPTSMADSADAAQWPTGALPVLLRSLAYGDDYRLDHAKALYGGAGSGTDQFVPPYLPHESYPSLATPIGDLRVKDQQFAYDDRGNMISASDDASDFYDRSLGVVTMNSGFGPGVVGPDQIKLAKSSDGLSSLSASYDNGGNLVEYSVSRPAEKTVYDYAWDELGRLASAVRHDGLGDILASQHRYTYDAQGNRIVVAKTDPASGSTAYTVRVFDSLILEHASFASDYENDGSTEHLYLNAGGLSFGHAFYDPSLPAAAGASANGVHVFMPLGDPLGSTSLVVDHDTGEIVERASYLPYGAVDNDYRPSRWGSFREDRRYTGQWDDAEVGLVYFGKRYYSPNLGRFISPDQLTVHGGAGSVNPYEYAQGSPMRFVDATGLDPIVTYEAPIPPPPPPDTFTLIVSVDLGTLLDGTTLDTLDRGGEIGGPFAASTGLSNNFGQTVGGPGQPGGPFPQGFDPPLPFNPGRQPTPLYLGNAAHQLIFNYYARVSGHRIYGDTSIRRIAQALGRQANVAFGLVRPDIYDVDTTGVYEVKSARNSNIGLAAQEARYYAYLLRQVGVNAILGSKTQAGTAGTIPAPGGYFSFVSPTPGVIAYQYLDVSRALSPVVAVDPSPLREAALVVLSLAGLSAVGSGGAVVTP
jgi:RHS repeat-associated protein